MKKFLIFLPILVLISGCAGVDAETETAIIADASSDASPEISFEAEIDPEDPDALIAALRTEVSSLNAELASLKQADTGEMAVINEVYNQALGLYNKSNYAESIAKFEEFLTKWPASDLADNAQYWVGECYYSLHDWSKALAAFQIVLNRYPTGNKISDATLKIGYTYREQAREYFNAVIKKYPSSNAARIAKQRLAN